MSLTLSFEGVDENQSDLSDNRCIPGSLEIHEQDFDWNELTNGKLSASSNTEDEPIETSKLGFGEVLFWVWEFSKDKNKPHLVTSTKAFPAVASESCYVVLEHHNIVPGYSSFFITPSADVYELSFFAESVLSQTRSGSEIEFWSSVALYPNIASNVVIHCWEGKQASACTRAICLDYGMELQEGILDQLITSALHPSTRTASWKLSYSNEDAHTVTEFARLVLARGEEFSKATHRSKKLCARAHRVRSTKPDRGAPGEDGTFIWKDKLIAKVDNLGRQASISGGFSVEDGARPRRKRFKSDRSDIIDKPCSTMVIGGETHANEKFHDAAPGEDSAECLPPVLRAEDSAPTNTNVNDVPEPHVARGVTALQARARRKGEITPDSESSSYSSSESEAEERPKPLISMQPPSAIAKMNISLKLPPKMTLPGLSSLNLDQDSRQRLEGGDEEKAFLLAKYHSVCSAIIPDALYLGGEAVATNLEQLKAAGITHILNTAGDTCPNFFPESFDYFTVILQDNKFSNETLESVLWPCLDYIDKSISEGGKVLVHCREGVSRSSTVVVSYLMWKNQLSFHEALEVVKKTRNVCNPNTGFTFSLLRFGKRLLCSLPPLSSETVRRGGTSVGFGPKIVERKLFRISLHHPSAPVLVVKGCAIFETMHQAWMPSHGIKIDPRLIYILRDNYTFYQWLGSKMPPQLEVFGMKVAEKFMLDTRRFENPDADWQWMTFEEGSEPQEFWELLFPNSTLEGGFMAVEERQMRISEVSEYSPEVDHISGLNPDESLFDPDGWKARLRKFRENCESPRIVFVPPGDKSIPYGSTGFRGQSGLLLGPATQRGLTPKNGTLNLSGIFPTALSPGQLKDRAVDSGVTDADNTARTKALWNPSPAPSPLPPERKSMELPAGQPGSGNDEVQHRSFTPAG